MRRQLFSLLAATAVLGGCASMTTVDDFRSTTEPLNISAGEKVVILGRRDAGHYETDRSFISCIGDEIDDAHFLVVPEEEFVDALYPWFEPRTAPKNLQRLKRLMEEPAISAKSPRFSAAEVSSEDNLGVRLTPAAEIS